MSKLNGIIKIDRDIPIPASYKRSAKYPWKDMQVGDSFWASGVSINTMRSAFRRHNPKRFICVAERNSTTHTDGVRVWRVE